MNALEAMRSHLYMDTNRVFSSKQAFPVIVKYLNDHGGRFPDQATMVRVLHWYLSVAIWGRFAGPTETVIPGSASSETETLSSRCCEI